MQNEINFLILTKSARYGGNCVVGIDLDSKKIIRLVSNNDKIKNSISDENMICQNGEIALQMDIVKIRLSQSLPSKYQPENMLLDDSYKWQKIRKSNFQDIEPYISDDEYIFCNSMPFLTETNINDAKKSIVIVKVNDVKICTQNIQYNTGEIKEKTKANFRYNLDEYRNLSITDRYYFGKNDNLSNALIVVSIPSESFNGYYYKFVSQIFVL